MSPSTRARIERAAKELGYQPNALASSLTTGRTKLIGLVSNNFHNPIFLQVFDLFTRGLQERGLRPLLVNLSNETDPESSLRMLRQYSVDGIIVASSTLPPSFAESYRAAGVPVVHSFGRLSEQANVDLVGIDNKECGRMAARELLSRGYKNLAMLAGPATATSTQDRRAGFKEVVESEGVKYSISYAEKYAFDAGYKEMQRLIDLDSVAEAYFCGDDVVSIGALSALQANGYVVPRDVGIIGLNDMEMAGWNNISLTTISQPIEKIVDWSIQLICEILEAPNTSPRSFSFECKVVTRDTLRE